MPLLTVPAHAQLRVVCYNIAGLNGNQTALEAVFSALNDDDKPGFAVAPHLYVFQEVGNGDANGLLTRLNAAAPPGISYTLGTFTINTPPNTNESGSAGAQAMFYRSDVLIEDAAAHADISTGAGRNGDRWKLRLVGYDSPDAAFYIYSCHLKASTGSSNESQRLSGATALRSNADALGPGLHIIYAGDWNVYNNGEPAYLKFLSVGNGQSFDPLGTGSWAGAGNAIKHTQAPCRNGCSLVSGGMDDRFDHVHGTAAFNDGEGLSLIPGTYRALGNDGLHYDTDIHAGNNSYHPADIPRSNTLADHLWSASDHVPVVAEYQVPAVLSATFNCPCDRVIQGAVVNAEVQITNAASALVASGADELDYDVEPFGALSGFASGTISALGPGQNVQLALATSSVGPFSGSVDLISNSQAAQVNDPIFFANGRVLRPANASFDEFTDLDDLTSAQTLPADSGVHLVAVSVFNLGFDIDQALLDIDGLSGVTAPFSVDGISPASGIGASGSTMTFAFDTTGLSPGDYSNVIEVSVSDEDIPGESGSVLQLTLSVTIPGGNADVDCDNDIDMDDVDTFALVLINLDTDACHVERSDFDGSGTPDGADVAPFVQAFLSP